VIPGPVIPVSALDERLEKVKSELSRLAQQARDLELEREMLVRLRLSAVTPGVVDADPISPENQPRLRLTTAEALYHVFRTKPGLTSGELVDECEPILDSASSDKRALLRSTISTWKRKGRFTIDQQGRYYLKREPGITNNGNGKHP
jgi:hypothetical protein